MEGGQGLSACDCEEVEIWQQIVSCPGILFALFVLLYTASFGMQHIYRGDLEKVTKVKLLDRGAVPSLRPHLLFITLSEKTAVSVKIPQGKMFWERRQQHLAIQPYKHLAVLALTGWTKVQMYSVK